MEWASIFSKAGLRRFCTIRRIFRLGGLRICENWGDKTCSGSHENLCHSESVRIAVSQYLCGFEAFRDGVRRNQFCLLTLVLGSSPGRPTKSAYGSVRERPETRPAHSSAGFLLSVSVRLGAAHLSSAEHQIPNSQSFSA